MKQEVEYVELTDDFMRRGVRVQSWILEGADLITIVLKIILEKT